MPPKTNVLPRHKNDRLNKKEIAMFNFLKALTALTLVFVITQPAWAEEPSIPMGAKSLFGQASDTAFLPREHGGTAGSARMDPTSRVDDNMLASGIHKQPDFPGIAYSLEVIRKGEGSITTVEDPRRYEFRTGDRVRMRLVPNFTGHAYVLEAKGSNASLVYPASFGTSENMITAGRECYVPVQGWLRLVDPAEPFTMRVLFKPGGVDYQLNQPTPNPAVARVSLTEAVHREWRMRSGQKGLVFEADNSYVESAPQAPSMPRPQAVRQPQALSQPQAMPQQQALSQPQALPQQQTVVHHQTVVQQQTVPSVLPTNYTTNYAVLVRSPQDLANQQDQPGIAIEVPIRHVSR